MTKVTIDAEPLRKLRHLAEPLVFCDESGRESGRITPAHLEPVEDEDREPRISSEELKRRMKEKGGYTTDEVLAHLKSLG